MNETTKHKSKKRKCYKTHALKKRKVFFGGGMGVKR